MAQFIRGTGSVHTPVEHAARIYGDYLQQTSLSNEMGRVGDSKPINLYTELNGNPGDQIRIHFIPQHQDGLGSTGDGGIHGQDASVTGNEDSLEEYSFLLGIDQEAKAFLKKGKMTSKRIIWNWRETGRRQLTTWWAQRNEALLWQSLTGIVNGTPASRTYVHAATDTTDLVNGDARCMASNGTGSEVVLAAGTDNVALHSLIASGDKMTVALIQDSVIQARTGGTYKMRPIRVEDGREFFVMYISIKASRDLRRTTDWKNHALSRIEAGLDDRIATGAIGIFDNVIVKESEFVVESTNVGGTNTFARNLLLGADALALGWVQRLDYVEERRDFGRIMAMCGDEIRGQTKVLFESPGSVTEDAGVLQVITASNPGT